MNATATAQRRPVRWSGSTWTRRRSTTPTTSWSMRAEPRSGAQAQHVQQRPRPRAARRAEAHRLRPDADGAARSVRDRPSRTRRSTCSSTAAPGGRARSRTTPSWRKWSCAPAPTGSGSTSTASRAPRAISCRWPIRCGAASPGSTRTAKSFGGDPNRIYVSGQSSGAHLAGCVVTTDWKDYGVPADIVKGALLCSGMYDLKPVRLSKRSDYVAFTDESEEKLSSQRRLDRLNCPVIVAYGTFETPEFQRQNREFADAVKKAGQAGHPAGRRGLQPLRDGRGTSANAELRRSGVGADG